MHPLILKLDATLRVGYPEYHAALGPGSTTQDLDELERVFGLPLPPLYRDFLAWRGPSPDGAAQEAGSLIFNQDLMTARQVADTVTGTRELRVGEPSWIAEVWWGENYLPILDSHSGDYICIDVAGEALLKQTRWNEATRTRDHVQDWQSIPGQIIDFTHDAEYREIHAPDFASWLEAITAAFTDRVFEISREVYSGTPYIGFEDTDDYGDLIRAAFGARNPGYPKDLEQQF